MSLADSFLLNLPSIPFKDRKDLPECSGIYYVITSDNEVWYIGQAINIKKRFS